MDYRKFDSDDDKRWPLMRSRSVTLWAIISHGVLTAILIAVLTFLFWLALELQNKC